MRLRTNKIHGEWRDEHYKYDSDSKKFVLIEKWKWQIVAVIISIFFLLKILSHRKTATVHVMYKHKY